ncbi:Potassium voltage-gated channel subfamily B member 1 [Psilocybe cubensis]|uniref:Potassium voltage-gated channel subfamily B member 1 n=2 Tax=Psilocybe cubensis TaxID=181762 RepID=A0ACB8H144_PSICU|nr:Potassium voltage-gated channel subfamily B member 1 [Psilocybe cubensis]KAH9480920.1 Potassium voltage-gated channel subfamily B member 1 [Psilocybe cubensis]
MTTTATSPTTDPHIELNRIRRPPPLSAVRFFTEENFSPPPSASASAHPHNIHNSNDNNYNAGNGPHGSQDHLPTSHSYDDAHSASNHIRPLWKRALFELLEQPTSSRAAFVVHMFTIFMIIFSASITVLETVPAVHSISTRVWFGVETSIVALFTVEYVARCLAWSYSWQSLFHWQFSFFGVIDLLSVLPYYLELLLQQDTSVFFRFSILRMFRLLRVFRPFRYNHTILLTMEVMYLSVRRSQHALLAIGFFVFMILTVFSTLLYFAERGTWDELLGTFINADGDPTQFSSIPAAAWFVLVTITTVGYGEITPRSFLGRLITLPILVCGLLLITLPSFVLGREFSLVWEKMTVGRGVGGAFGGAERNGNGGTEGDADGEGADAEARRREMYAHDNHSLYSPEFSTRRLGQQQPRQYPSYAAYPSYAGHTPYPPRTPAFALGSGVSGLGSASGPEGTMRSRGRDLSNLKLAQNQTELSRQIEELAAAVDVQGRVLERLVGMLDELSGGKEVGEKKAWLERKRDAAS